MSDDEVSRLFELADLIHAISRQLRPPSDLEPGICTAVEINVMRFITKNPGTSASIASAATLLPSSNFSRILRGLEAKGLVQRRSDTRDARSVRLYPTTLAKKNFSRLRDAWSRSLEGIVDDSATVDAINLTLRRIETELIARRRPSAD